MRLTRQLQSALSRRSGTQPRLGTPAHREPRTGQHAVPVQGVDPTGEPVSIDVEEGRVVLLFLTSSCRPCQPLWAGAQPDGSIIVTPSPSTESRKRVAQLARPTQVVVMSSEAWHAYGVRRAPWLVIIDEGLVALDSPAQAGPAS